MTLKSEENEDALSHLHRAGSSAQLKAPFALIASAQDSPRELEALLRFHGQVITFPSLSHFCGAQSLHEQWAAVVVARACAWDDRLDGHVPARRCLALFGRALEREWPAGVRRLRSVESAEAWLHELESEQKPLKAGPPARKASGMQPVVRSPGPRERSEAPPSSLVDARGVPGRSGHPTPVDARGVPGRSGHPTPVDARGVPGRSGHPTPAPPRTRPFERGEYLLLGPSEESTLGLLNTLRRVRRARHVRELSELPMELHASAPWTGVLALHQSNDQVSMLLRDDSLLGIWRAEGGRPHPWARLLDDESSLFAWMAHTIALEHTGCVAMAQRVEHLTLEYGLTPQHVEVLCVAARTSQPEERAELLTMSAGEARAALKDLCDAARGVPVPHLVARVLEPRTDR